MNHAIEYDVQIVPVRGARRPLEDIFGQFFVFRTIVTRAILSYT